MVTTIRIVILCQVNLTTEWGCGIEDAYGVFSFERQDEAVGIGQGSEFGGGLQNNTLDESDAMMNFNFYDPTRILFGKKRDS